MKGRILRKLKSIPTPTWRPGLVFQANTPIPIFQTKEQNNHGLSTLIGKNLSISDIIEDVQPEELSSGPNADSKEKFLPSMRSNDDKEVASIPMHDSSAAFDSSLEIVTSVWRTSILETDSPPHSILLPIEDKIKGKTEEDKDKDKLQLMPDFEEKCPPGGREFVILYTTSLRGIRKTFDDCNTIRFLLESFRVLYYERDVSMHLEYREELWRVLGGRVVPPRLFIKGRYIGGADEVLGLHEKGMLLNLLQGIPLSPSNCPCKGCAGMHFVLCSSCNGSRKVMSEDGPSMRCPDCNENGLIKCSVCS